MLPSSTKAQETPAGKTQLLWKRKRHTFRKRHRAESSRKRHLVYGQMSARQNHPAKTSSKAIRLYPFFESNKKPSHINLLGKKRCRRQVQQSTPFCKWSGHAPREAVLANTLRENVWTNLIPWCSHRTCGILRLTEQPWVTGQKDRVPFADHHCHERLSFILTILVMTIRFEAKTLLLAHLGRYLLMRWAVHCFMLQY